MHCIFTFVWLMLTDSYCHPEWLVVSLFNSILVLYGWKLQIINKTKQKEKSQGEVDDKYRGISETLPTVPRDTWFLSSDIESQIVDSLEGDSSFPWKVPEPPLVENNHNICKIQKRILPLAWN